MVSLIITIVIFCLIEFTASKVEAIYLQKKQSIQTENKEITKKEFFFIQGDICDKEVLRNIFKNNKNQRNKNGK